jgi:hypothetical protein
VVIGFHFHWDDEGKFCKTYLFIGPTQWLDRAIPQATMKSVLVNAIPTAVAN